jgi:hypothetical protein
MNLLNFILFAVKYVFKLCKWGRYEPIRQKHPETEEDLGNGVMSICSRIGLHFLYNEVKKNGDKFKYFLLKYDRF